MKRLSTTIAALIVLGANPFVFAKPPAPPAARPLDPLPAAAQKALDKGVVAAQAGDYPSAIELFEQARALAPQSAILFLNRGLAESKMPSRELRAIAWFGAYLAVAPDAANAPAVKRQIAALQIQNRQTIARFTASVTAAARLTQFKSDQGKAQANHAVALVGIGDVAGAKAVADTIVSAISKSQALRAIAQKLAAGGDKAGARALLAVASTAASDEDNNLWEKLTALQEIGSDQEALGDAENARLTLAATRSAIEKFSDPKDKATAWIQFAKGRLKAGHSDDARAALAAADASAGRITDAYWATQTASAVGQAQAQAGDFPGAFRTASRLTDGHEKGTVQAAIVEAQTRRGDLAGAKATVERMDDGKKDTARRQIVRTQIEMGDKAGAQATLLEVDRVPGKKTSALEACVSMAALAELQARAGDFQGAQASLDAALKAEKRVRPAPASGLSGKNADQWRARNACAGATLISGGPAGIWLEKLLHGPLSEPPFTDLAAHAKALHDAFPGDLVLSSPEAYVQRLLETTTKLNDERDAVERLVLKN